MVKAESKSKPILEELLYELTYEQSIIFMGFLLDQALGQRATEYFGITEPRRSVLSHCLAEISINLQRKYWDQTLWLIIFLLIHSRLKIQSPILTI